MLNWSWRSLHANPVLLLTRLSQLQNLCHSKQVAGLNVCKPHQHRKRTWHLFVCQELPCLPAYLQTLFGNEQLVEQHLVTILSFLCGTHKDWQHGWDVLHAWSTGTDLPKHCRCQMECGHLPSYKQRIQGQKVFSSLSTNHISSPTSSNFAQSGNENSSPKYKMQHGRHPAMVYGGPSPRQDNTRVKYSVSRAPSCHESTAHHKKIDWKTTTEIKAIWHDKYSSELHAWEYSTFEGFQ